MFVTPSKTSAKVYVWLPESQMESPARALLPIVHKYLASDQWKRDYAEWKANKDKKTNIEYENNSINKING